MTQTICTKRAIENAGPAFIGRRAIFVCDEGSKFAGAAGNEPKPSDLSLRIKRADLLCRGQHPAKVSSVDYGGAARRRSIGSNLE